MHSTMINVTPSKFWAFINKILRRKTYWTIAYNSVRNCGYDWFDDDYETPEQALKSAQDYFDLECQECFYECKMNKMIRDMPVTLARYYFFNDERRYVEARETKLYFEYYGD